MRPGKPRETFRAEFLPNGWMREQDLCARVGISQDVLQVCLRWDVIPPPTFEEGGLPFYPSGTEDRLRSGLRLHKDLGVNWMGVAIILDLVDQLETLQFRLRECMDEQGKHWGV